MRIKKIKKEEAHNHSSKLSKIKNYDHYDVIIIGAGIAGLTAATEAQQQGKSVLLIEKRDRNSYDLRPQQVVINQSDISKELFDKLYSDNCDFKPSMISKGMTSSLAEKWDFRLNGESGGSVISIKNLQRLLLEEFEAGIKSAIEDESDEEEFEMGAQDTQNQKSMVCFSTKATNINLEKGKISIKDDKGNTKTLSFQYLIGADGKHNPNKKNNSDDLDSVDLVNEKNPNHPVVAYEKSSYLTSYLTVPHQHHISAYLTIERADGKPLPIPSVHSVFGITKEAYKFALLFKPRIEREGKSIKLSFSGEIPSAIKGKEDKEKYKQKVLQYIEKTVNDYYKMSGLNDSRIIVKIAPDSKKHGQKKDNLKFSPFELGEILRCKKAVFSSKSGKHFFLVVGDKYHTPIYIVGHGAQDGYRDAKDFARYLLAPKNPDYNAYQRSLASRRAAAVQQVAVFYSLSPNNCPRFSWALSFLKVGPSFLLYQINNAAANNHLLPGLSKKKKDTSIRGDVRQKIIAACNQYLENQEKPANSCCGLFSYDSVDQKNAQSLLKEVNNEEMSPAAFLRSLYDKMGASGNQADSLAMYIVREFQNIGNEKESRAAWAKGKTSDDISGEKQSFMSIIPSFRSQSILCDYSDSQQIACL